MLCPGCLAVEGGHLHRPDHALRGRHGDQCVAAVSQGGPSCAEGHPGGRAQYLDINYY